METMLNFMLVEHFWYATINEAERGMGYPRMLTPYRRPFATKDGYLCVIAVSDAQWRGMFAAMGQPELIDDPRYCSVYARAQNVEAVYEILANGLKQRTSAEWTALLTAADIPNGPANTLPDLLRDAYLRETGFFQTVQHPTEGEVTTTAVPSAFSATPCAVNRLWPTLGQHTGEVLREAGLTDAEIEAATGR
jgi:crotonobetainyl-CoA:carnitine CoA-transferase CaiB-like acyl-CoA transferase